MNSFIVTDEEGRVVSHPGGLELLTHAEEIGRVIEDYPDDEGRPSLYALLPLKDIQEAIHILVQFDRGASAAQVLDDLAAHARGLPWPSYEWHTVRNL